MNKFFLISFLILIQPMHAFILDGLLQIKETAKEKRIAAEDLEPYLPQIASSRKTIFTSNAIITLDNYWCESFAARKSLCEYKRVENDLKKKLSVSNFFDSIVLGMIAAYCHIKFDKTIPIIGATFLGALGIVMYQNHTMIDVPNFDCLLKKDNDEFKNLSFSSLLKVALIFIKAECIAFVVSGLLVNSIYSASTTSLLNEFN